MTWGPRVDIPPGPGGACTAMRVDCIVIRRWARAVRGDPGTSDGAALSVLRQGKEKSKGKISDRAGVGCVQGA